MRYEVNHEGTKTRRIFEARLRAFESSWFLRISSI
jgi:hypothetical protein